MKQENRFERTNKMWIYKWLALIVIFSAIPILPFSNYAIHLANEILIMGLFAVAFNLLFGYTGMLSFGQAAFYGIGAYTIGILVPKTQTPYWVAMLLGVGFSALAAIILGGLCIRSKGIFFTMLTLAFGQLLWGIAFKLYGFTGGDNGIQGISVPAFLRSSYSYYYFCILIVFVSFYFCGKVVRSPFGCILKCIRQNPERAEFIGIKIRRFQLSIYILSSTLTGLAGILFAGYEHSVHPNLMHWTKSGEVILMTIAGGFSTFFGPVIGAGIIILIEDAVGARTEYWEIWLGSIMLIIVLLFPSGVAGSVHFNWTRLRKRLSTFGV